MFQLAAKYDFISKLEAYAQNKNKKSNLLCHVATGPRYLPHPFAQVCSVTL